MSFHFHSSRKALETSIVLNVLFSLVEGLFGVIANSTALISDAVHDLADAFSLGVSWLASMQSGRAPTKRYSFGFYRWSVLAALLNSIVLFGVTAFIFLRAYERLLHPQPVNGWIVFVVAFVGIIINLVVVRKLSHHRDDVNARSAFWHMLEDLMSWVAVLIAGVILVVTGWTWIDPLMSIIVGFFVAYGAISVLRESVRILTEGVPRDINIDEVTKAIAQMEYVETVHDLHVWTLGADVTTLSCHIQLPNMELRQARYVIDKIEKMLHDRFHIQHATVEVETKEQVCMPGKKCD